jgi:hypothetical protein
MLNIVSSLGHKRRQQGTTLAATGVATDETGIRPTRNRPTTRQGCAGRPASSLEPAGMGAVGEERPMVVGDLGGWAVPSNERQPKRKDFLCIT